MVDNDKRTSFNCYIDAIMNKIMNMSQNISIERFNFQLSINFDERIIIAIFMLIISILGISGNALIVGLFGALEQLINGSKN